MEMIEPEEHASADGLLTLAVESLKDGDVAIGFRGYPWHTHADILASISAMNETDSVRQKTIIRNNNRRRTDFTVRRLFFWIRIELHFLRNSKQKLCSCPSLHSWNASERPFF